MCTCFVYYVYTYTASTREDKFVLEVSTSNQRLNWKLHRFESWPMLTVMYKIRKCWRTSTITLVRAYKSHKKAITSARLTNQRLNQCAFAINFQLFRRETIWKLNRAQTWMSGGAWKSVGKLKGEESLVKSPPRRIIKARVKGAPKEIL